MPPREPGGARGGAGVPLQFIDLSSSSDQDRDLNQHIARSHVARLSRARGRHRRAQAGQLHRSPDVVPVAGLQHTPPTFPELPQYPQGLVRSFSDTSIGAGSTEGSSPIASSRIPATGEASHITSPGETLGEPHLNQSPAPLPPLTRTVAPVFGGLSIETFDSGGDPVAAGLVNSFLRSFFGRTFMSESSAFRTFCSDPMVYHGFSHLCLMTSALETNRLSAATEQRMIMHMTESSRLLNESLSRLEPSEIFMNILALVTLFPEARNVRTALRRQPMLFLPPIPTLNVAYMLGTIDVNSPAVKSAQNALSSLIKLAGGFDQLKQHGMALLVMAVDVVINSAQFNRPWFSFRGQTDALMLLTSGWLSFAPHGDHSVGSGFRDLASSGLFQSTTRVCINLSALDELLTQSRRRRPSDSDTQLLQASQLETQHALMSLRPWDELDSFERQGGSRTIYECCRLTASLYSNCVVLPMPPEFDGVKKPLQQLKVLHEAIYLDEWTEEASKMMIWSLLIAAIAAYRTPNKDSFVAMLKNAVTKSEVLDLGTAQDIARLFVYSKIACERGAIVLWDSMELNATEV